jgi:hypothetical protein
MNHYSASECCSSCMIVRLLVDWSVLTYNLEIRLEVNNFQTHSTDTFQVLRCVYQYFDCLCHKGKDLLLFLGGCALFFSENVSLVFVYIYIVITVWIDAYNEWNVCKECALAETRASSETSTCFWLRLRFF